MRIVFATIILFLKVKYEENFKYSACNNYTHNIQAIHWQWKYLKLHWRAKQMLKKHLSCVVFASNAPRKIELRSFQVFHDVNE